MSFLILLRALFLIDCLILPFLDGSGSQPSELTMIQRPFLGLEEGSRGAQGGQGRAKDGQ